MAGIFRFASSLLLALLFVPAASSQELKQPKLIDVWSIAVSKDGKTVAGSSGWWTEPGEIGIWKVGTWEPLRRFSDDLGIASVAFSSDGKLLASGGWTGHVRVYDWAANKELADFDGVGLSRVAWSPDDKLLATATEKKTVQLWDMAKFKHVADLEGDLLRFHCVMFSPDGKFVMAGGGDWKQGGVNQVTIWDVESRQQVGKLVGHDNAVICMTYSPDGNTIATGGIDKTIRLWDAKSRKHLKTLAGHTNWVEALLFAADGKTLLSGGRDRTVRFWDVEAGVEKKASLIKIPGSIRALQFTPDGKGLFVGGGPKLLKVIDLTTRAEAASLWNGDEPAKIALRDDVPAVVVPRQKVAMDEMPVAVPAKPSASRGWLIAGLIIVVVMAGFLAAAVGAWFFVSRRGSQPAR
jgi:WD40 repeat protein